MAYPYSYDDRGYRELLAAQESAFYIRFRFANDTPHAAHIADKVRDLILRSRLSVFDLSGWNPNVALEYGIALGMRLQPSRIWLLLNTAESSDVPSDLRGFAQNRYDSIEDLARKLPTWLASRFRPRESTS